MACTSPSTDSRRLRSASPAAADQWGWEMAKLVVQVADGNYHELVAHLARTHLVIEGVAMATHRHLATVHPVWALLVPHFEGTLFINYEAATSLITAGGPIDRIFGGSGAAQVWHSTERRGVDGRPIPIMRLCSECPDMEINSQWQAGRLSSTIRTDINGSLVVFDAVRANGLTVQQLAQAAE